MAASGLKEAKLTVGEGTVFRSAPLTGEGEGILREAEEQMVVSYWPIFTRTVDGKIHFCTEHGWLSRRPDQRGKDGFL